MHHVIAWAVVVATAIFAVGCVDPVGPTGHGSDALARHQPPPESLPDSVRIPPFPFPPIFEELPPILAGPQ